MISGYGNNVLDRFLGDLGSADTLASVMTTLVEQSGFSSFTHVGLRGFSPMQNQPPYVTTVKPSWEQHYQTHELAHRDPSLSKCLTGTVPVKFTDLDPSSLPKEHLATMSAAEDFKMNLGISIPVHGPNNSLSVLSIYHDGNHRTFKDATQMVPILTMAALHVHEHLMTQSQSPVPPPTSLTERELECLVWTAHGKTSWEISMILKVSERTVKFHLNNVMRKLGVHSRTHAVARAVSLGLTQP